MQVVNFPEGRAHPKTELCTKLAKLFDEDDLPTYIILDGTDYSSEQSKYLKEFEGPAFRWIKGKSADSHPAQFIELTKDSKCKEIYWFSLQALKYSEMMFTWLFFHEFRHGYQSRTQFACSKERGDLRKIKNDLTRQKFLFVFGGTDLDVDELDADLFAFRQMQKIHRKSALSGFMASTDYIPRNGLADDYASFIEALINKLAVETSWFESFYEYRPVKSSHAPS
jgi:hypothetical protein